MSASPRLTIGMAVFDDYDGAYFTLQSLRLNNNLQNVELVVIDNKPDCAGGQALKSLVTNWLHHNTAGAKYFEFGHTVGTTQSRNAIFDNASGDNVMCLDSHVLLHPGTIDRLQNWFDSNPDNKDLISGPIMMDDLRNISTQYNDVWRAEMWGIWGQAWQCPCGHLKFSIIEKEGSPLAQPIALLPGATPVTFCGKCKKQLPEIALVGHQQPLYQAGYIALGHDDSSNAFEIPGQGLGLFATNRQGWLDVGGFNRDFRGFGGEEMYIHTKYRMHGRKNLCLPFLKWVHRFARPNGVKFPLTRYNKVRNYVLGANELGLSLDPIYNHFVKTGLTSQAEWEHLIKDPVKHLEGLNAAGGCGTCGQPATIPDAIKNAKSVADLFSYTKSQPRDLEKHFDKLIELAMKCDSITEFTKRKESTVAFAAANPIKQTVYSTEANSAIIHKLQELSAREDLKISIGDSSKVESIEETDLLFIDSTHTANVLVSELDKFAKSVKRFIVLRGTQTNGETGEDGGPGLLPALRKFLKEQPEWSVVYHTQEQYGLTVIGRLAEDKPKLPGMITMATNFATALAKHVATGALMAELPVYEKRLEICTTCPQRNEGNCSVCGCVITAKASFQSSICPIGNW